MRLPVSRNCKNFMVYSFLLSLGRNEKGAARGGSGNGGVGGGGDVVGGLKLEGLAPYFKINLF